MEGEMPRNLDLRRVDIDVGAARPFKALLVADAHLALADARENDPRKLALAANRGPWFRDAARFLDEAVRRAREEGAIPLLAGDIWDFVSIRNIEAAKHVFAEGDWFACVGNHEFSQYVGEAREDEDYKAQSAERVASVWPNDTSFASRVVNGVNFVAVDDVYYNFTERQLSLMEGEAAKGLPIVLICHVPLYLPGHYAEQMRRKGGICSYETGVPDELVNTWKIERDFPPGEEWCDRRAQQRADAPTKAFVAYLKALPLLKAILCGHNHAFWVERFSPSAVQCVCGGLYCGEGCLIDFR